MKRKYQAVHIPTIAKKNFCNEISLGDYTYEEEIKGRLNDYFNDNIKDEDSRYLLIVSKTPEKICLLNSSNLFLYLFLMFLNHLNTCHL